MPIWGTDEQGMLPLNIEWDVIYDNEIDHFEIEVEFIRFTEILSNRMEDMKKDIGNNFEMLSARQKDIMRK